MIGRAQRDHLEQLQLETRALEKRLTELRSKIRATRKKAEGAAHLCKTGLAALQEARAENDRTGAGPLPNNEPASPSMLLFLGGLLFFGIASVVLHAWR